MNNYSLPPFQKSKINRKLLKYNFHNLAMRGRRSKFKDHRRCIEKHKQQRILFHNTNGKDVVIAKETISFCPLGLEYYYDEITGTRHVLNRLTGECSCTSTTDKTNKTKSWPRLIPLILRQLLDTNLSINIIEPEVTHIIPENLRDFNKSLSCLMLLSDEINQLNLECSSPLNLTYLPISNVVALEDSSTQQVIWKSSQTHMS